MNPLRPQSSLARLLFGSNGARTVIGVRHASTEAAVATTAATVPVPAARSTTQPADDDGTQRQGGRRSRGIPPPGHGERLWVYNHIVDNFTIYSLTPELKSNKAFRQMVYTGKKLIPAKLRKDYWRPMVVVEFGEGRGDVGRSVFQKLRELKKRHQLEWDDPALLRMSKRERGKAINDQRGNSVADLAAVLAGRGKGNRVVFVDDADGRKRGTGVKRGEKKEKVEEVEKAEEGASTATAAKEDEGVVEVTMEKKEGEEPAKKVKLYQATVYWANEQDKYYAESWTENVTHVVGLPEKGKKGEEVVEAAQPVETEAAAEVPEAAKSE